MFSGKWLAPAVVIAAGLAVAVLVATGKPAPQPRPPEPQRAPIVQVVAAAPRELALTVSTQGTVTPRREINIVSQVAGLVEAVSPGFAEGAFFSAGGELARIERADYEFARLRAEARVADAEQQVALEKGRSRQAAREWRELGNAEANELFLRKPQLASAEAALRAARADLEAALLDLRRTSIRAPFNGRVSEKHVDIGQFVSPGTVVARVYGTDVAEVRVPLTDRQVALLELPLSFEDRSAVGEGAPVTLSARFAERLWHWRGRVARTDASIDVDSRVVYAVVEVQRPFARSEDARPPLAIGLFVEAEIVGRRLAGVSVLPRAALRNDGGVLVVDEEERIRPREVRVLKSSPGQVWLQGLGGGERVVVSSLPLAIPGMRVTPREEGAPLARSPRP